MDVICELGPTAPMMTEGQRTPPGVGAWIANQLGLIRKEVDGRELTANIWGYRMGRAQLLSCDISDENGKNYSLTFNTGQAHNFADHDPMVPDMVEALHIAALLAQRLGCSVSLGF